MDHRTTGRRRDMSVAVPGSLPQRWYRTPLHDLLRLAPAFHGAGLDPVVEVGVSAAPEKSREYVFRIFADGNPVAETAPMVRAGESETS